MSAPAFRLPARKEFPSELTRVTLAGSLTILLGDWLLIAAAIHVASRYPGMLSFLVAQLVVASRQHAFFLAMHEATHYLLCRDRTWNDRISNWLAAWPVGFSTERYRLRHWLHHRYLNTERDPDWARKKPDPTWRFPMSKARFWRTSLPHLFGKGAREMAYAFRGIGITRQDLPYALPYYACLAMGISAFGAWKLFFLYWALPYFTVLPFLHRVRNASDHLALPKEHALNGTRNVLRSGAEAFFFGPHGANLHLVHHLYPFVPSYRLR